MDKNLELPYHEKTKQAKKMMLYIAMISFTMAFTGLLSGYIISKERPDWLNGYEIPNAFYISTFLILLSSLTFHIAFKKLLKDDRKLILPLLIVTLILGLGFFYFQIASFSELLELTGYYFTGKGGSNVTVSFVYIIVGLHLAHLIFGIISILFVIYNQSKQKYNPLNSLGFELSLIFWHFLDILWLLLFLFLYFFR